MNCINRSTWLIRTWLSCTRMLRFFIVILSLLILTACSGDDETIIVVDGSDSGSNAQPCSASNIPEKLTATIASANVPEDGKVVVDFSVVDGAGYDYACLASNQVRFTIAKLNPPSVLGAGLSSSWQSYINRTEAAPTNPANGPGTTAQIQATSETNGVLTNNEDGTYRYVFNANIKAVSSPLAVTYNATYTHRVGVQISGGGLPAENATYDWQPSSGDTTGILGRDIVATESCNSCHGELALHGGGRKDVEYCVTCHNPGTTDANSGNTVNFATMVHKIHRGKELPSVEDGAEYAIWGNRDTKDNYSEVGFPQDIRNCRTCHDEENEATPDAHNWLTIATVETCGSCHDDVNFTTGVNHEAGARTDAECSTCHVGGSGNQLEIERSHEIGGKAAAKELMAVRVDSTSIDGTNGDVQVLFSLINPSNNDSVYSQRVSDMNFVFRDSRTAPRLYRNKVNPDTGYIDNNTALNLDTAPFNAETGQYSWDTGVVLGDDEVLAFASRIRLCTNEKDGGLVNCADTGATTVRAPATPVCGNIDDTGEQVAVEDTLPIGAEYERCTTCHKGPSIPVHGGDYSSLQQCRSCHNNSFLRVNSPDNGIYRNADFKYAVHAYHASNYQNGSGVVEEIEYPGSIDNCTKCHEKSQVTLPIQANFYAAQTRTGLYTSSTAFLCSSCHVSARPSQVDPSNLSNLSREDQSKIGHMLQMGAVFNGTQAAANVTESCAVCHASGRDFAIDEKHGLLE